MAYKNLFFSENFHKHFDSEAQKDLRCAEKKLQKTLAFLPSWHTFFHCTIFFHLSEQSIMSHHSTFSTFYPF